MAKDKNVNININADGKNAETGIKKVESQLNSLAKTVSKSPITRLSKSFSAVGVAVGVAVGAVKKATQAISELADTYEVQAKAEIQLETSAKNNPYLNSTNVQKLKDYAGELQKIYAVGDEQLLPLMSNLAAAGRTQAEIQDIMVAALDASAGGAISLESAVKGLNSSYSGSVGQLGKLLPSLKNLTEEELKQGGAVKAVKASFDGMGKSINDQIGGWTKFKNSFGDFQEVMGNPLSVARNAIGSTLSSFFDKVTEAIGKSSKAAEKFKKELGIITQNETGKATLSSLQDEKAMLEENVKAWEKERKARSMTRDEYIRATKDEEKATKERYKTETAEIGKLKSELNMLNNERAAYMSGNLSGWSNEDYAQAGIRLEEITKKIAVYDSTIGAALKTQSENVKNAKKEWAELNKGGENTVSSLEKRISDANKRIQELTPEIKKLNDAQGAGEKETERQKQLKEHTESIVKQNQELDKQISIIQKKAEIEGKDADKQAILNAYTEAYIKMWQTDGDWAKTRLAEIRKEIEKITSSMKENEVEEFLKKFGVEASPIEKLKNEIETLDAEYNRLINSTELSEEEKYAIREAWAKKTEELYKKLGDAEIAEVQNTAINVQDVMNTVSSLMSNLTQSVQTLAKIGEDTAENEAKAKTASLEKQYADGLISEKEYQEGKERIEKEAAKKAYKMQMWAWSAQLLQIGASTAQAIMQALATSGNIYAGIALSATAGALGAAQLAAAVASKPVPPSFYTGGVVGGMSGASMGGDNTYIHARRGELILNAKQQRELWEMANGASGGGIGLNVQVKNYASNDVQTSQQLTSDGLEIVITRLMEKKISDGSMNDAITSAQNKMGGISYTS